MHKKTEYDGINDTMCECDGNERVCAPTLSLNVTSRKMREQRYPFKISLGVKISFEERRRSL
jgi:hypothetical protein